jgi:hypothetical protein
MDVVPEFLNRAAQRAGEELERRSLQTAAAGVSHASFASTQRTMAQAAEAAVFADALIGALHARIAEAKAATR